MLKALLQSIPLATIIHGPASRMLVALLMSHKSSKKQSVYFTFSLISILIHADYCFVPKAREGSQGAQISCSYSCTIVLTAKIQAY